MNNLETKDAVEDLQQVFSEFKNANDERLEQLETRSGVDPLTEAKADRLNAELDRLESRVEGMQASLKRSPVEFDVATVDAAEEKSAFGAFVRKGDDSLLQKGLNASVDAEGGHMVPTYLAEQIVSYVKAQTPVRDLANVINIGTDAVDLLIDADDAASAWVAETAVRNETGAPNVGKVSIPVHELYAEPRITQRLLDDAQFDVDMWLSQKIADRMARAENDAFINGDGVGKPRGFLTYADGTGFGEIEQFKTRANGDWAASNPGDTLLEAMLGLGSSYADGAVWLMNRNTLADIRKFKGNDGQYLWQPAGDKMHSNLLGYEVKLAEDMPTKTTDALGVAFGNFKAGYAIADRHDMRILRDPFTAKPYVKFYATKRVGGDVVNFEAIKLVRFAA